MPGKLLSAVKGEGLDEVLEPAEQGDDGFGDRLGGLPVHGPGEPELGLSFVEGDQCPLMGPFPIMVSASQSPRRPLRLATSGRASMSTRLGMPLELPVPL